MPDHVHLLVGWHQDLSISTFLEKLKSSSTGWVRHHLSKEFGWQIGYGAFSVSESQSEAVRRYIRNQKKHHSKMRFEEEFIALLKPIVSILNRNFCSNDALSPASRALDFSGCPHSSQTRYGLHAGRKLRLLVESETHRTTR